MYSAVPIGAFQKIQAPERFSRKPIQQPCLNCGSKRFDQVQAEAVPISGISVDESEGHIQPASDRSQSAFALSHGCRVIKQGVRRVHGKPWTAGQRRMSGAESKPMIWHP